MSLPTRRVLTAGAATFLVACIVIGSALLFGKTGVREFSPDTLEMRWYHDYRIPIVGLRVWRTIQPATRYSLVENLKALGYWTPIESNEPRWMLMWRHSQLGDDFESPIDREFTKEPRFTDWLNWTDEYPDLAALVWKMVLEDLRSTSPDGPDDAMRVLRAARDTHDIDDFLAWLQSERGE